MGENIPNAKYKDLMILREGVDPYAKVGISGQWCQVNYTYHSPNRIPPGF
jgi:hypothetical protein